MEKRYKQLNPCKECKTLEINCEDSRRCEPVRKDKLHSYSGIRLTSDGFDCALPVAIDSHSACAYECLYCFSDNILSHALNKKKIGQTSLAKIEKIFSGERSKNNDLIRKALRYDKVGKDRKYPCPVQLGGLCDTGDSIEQNQGWLLQFLKIAQKYGQPVRMSTKGAVFLMDDYKKVVQENPELLWVAFSIITDDDTIIKKVDRGAPDASTRLKAMKQLSDMGVSTSLRLRPIMKGITDRKKAWQTLIEKAAEAGASAISYEVGFYPMTIPKAEIWKWAELKKIARFDYEKMYKSFGRSQNCMRPSYLWTEEIMHSIKEHAVKHGLTVGVSDPAWKQLTDTGCCCGILPDDSVFGNWERENATNSIYKACQGENDGLIYFADIIPPWADQMLEDKMINPGAGAKYNIFIRIRTWKDNLWEKWNNPSKDRSPINYFQGAVQLHLNKDGTPAKDDEGNYIYKYVGLKRHNKKTGWSV